MKYYYGNIASVPYLRVLHMNQEEIRDQGSMEILMYELKSVKFHRY